MSKKIFRYFGLRRRPDGVIESIGALNSIENFIFIYLRNRKTCMNIIKRTPYARD